MDHLIHADKTSANDEIGYRLLKNLESNGITLTSEAVGYELDGAGLTIRGRLYNSIKIREKNIYNEYD